MSTNNAASKVKGQPLAGKKVAILVAHGFEEDELTSPRQALEQAGARTQVVSPESGKVKGWKHTDWGKEVAVDVPLDTAKPEDYDALVLPGGVMNPDHLRRNQKALGFIRAFFTNGKPVGAICHGPWTLIDAVVSPFGQGGLPGATTDLYQAGFDANWEIDVFGGKRRRVEAAAAEVAAAAESRHALQVSLAAETARDYLELRGSQERLRIARENLAAQSNVLVLTRSKRSVGLASDLNEVRATGEVEAISSTLAPLEADCRRLIHALSTLTGQEPGQLSPALETFQPLPTNPPDIPVGLPSQLLTRRADIKEAEREMAAANARIGAARAELFPKFALIANAGLDSTSPGNLLDWDSRYFLISPTVSWRIFDAGRIVANIRLQQANEQEAGLQYRNTVLGALREVEDALVAYAAEQTRRTHLTEECRQAENAESKKGLEYEWSLTGGRPRWATVHARCVSGRDFNCSATSSLGLLTG